MDNSAMFKLSYGLFVLSSRDDVKDNACIVNTVEQVTTVPNRVTVAVNKSNLTHDIIKKTGLFNVSILSNDVPFDLFKHFGFQSGRDIDKFENYDNKERSENGLIYLPKHTNSYISGKVVSTFDLGTHTMFLADVVDANVLSNGESLTYDYYHKNIKQTSKKTAAKGWRCKICGYVYEGDPLPDDFICPICKHGKIDFEKI